MSKKKVRRLGLKCVDTFPLIYTTLPTKIKYLRLFSAVDNLQLKNIFFLLNSLKVLR